MANPNTAWRYMSSWEYVTEREARDGYGDDDVAAFKAQYPAPEYVVRRKYRSHGRGVNRRRVMYVGVYKRPQA